MRGAGELPESVDYRTVRIAERKKIRKPMISIERDIRATAWGPMAIVRTI
jgi:hypothetical protein